MSQKVLHMSQKVFLLTTFLPMPNPKSDEAIRQKRYRQQKKPAAAATEAEKVKATDKAAKYSNNKRSSKAMSSFGGPHQGTAPGDTPGVTQNHSASAPPYQYYTFSPMGPHQGTLPGGVPGVTQNHSASAPPYQQNTFTSPMGPHQGTLPGGVPGVAQNHFAWAPPFQQNKFTSPMGPHQGTLPGGAPGGVTQNTSGQNTFYSPRPLPATPAQIHCHAASLHSEALAQRMACKRENDKIDGELLSKLVTEHKEARVSSDAQFDKILGEFSKKQQKDSDFMQSHREEEAQSANHYSSAIAAMGNSRNPKTPTTVDQNIRLFNNSPHPNSMAGRASADAMDVT